MSPQLIPVPYPAWVRARSVHYCKKCGTRIGKSVLFLVDANNSGDYCKTCGMAEMLKRYA
jgi:hypothetical protein